MPAFGPCFRSSLRSSSPSGSRGHLQQLIGLCGQHRSVRRGEERLAGAGDAGGEDPPAGGVELREHVIEEEKRQEAAAGRDELALGKEEREDGETLLALRPEAA